MRLTASDFYTFYRPSRCETRVFLSAKGEKSAPIGPFEEVLFRLGKRLEQDHLATFAEVLNLSGVPISERVAQTTVAIQSGTPVIYQGALQVSAVVGGVQCEIVGEPDFLVREGAGYVIRDCKLAKHVSDDDHPEIIRQLQLYGWLYRQTVGSDPVRLEVLGGTAGIVPVDYGNATFAFADLTSIVGYASLKDEPFSPVGWTKCDDCGYRGRCWSKAEEIHDVSLLPGVDQGLGRAFRNENVISYHDLIVRYSEAELSELKRPWGEKLQKVGKGAKAILTSAQAMAAGKEIVLATPNIPEAPNYVMFDLEGMPPFIDEMEKVYLWGMQVFGVQPSEHMAAMSDFGEDGDRFGWERFLDFAKAILDRDPTIKFVHWHHYERAKLDLYVKRFGDRDGIAARVRGQLLDLLPTTRAAVSLPLPSYSLKVIEKHVGYTRKLQGFAGDTAMARYIEATETTNTEMRDSVMEEIRLYNQEDLAATWAVMQWLRTLRPPA